MILILVICLLETHEAGNVEPDQVKVDYMTRENKMPKFKVEFTLKKQQQVMVIAIRYSCQLEFLKHRLTKNSCHGQNQELEEGVLFFIWQAEET